MTVNKLIEAISIALHTEFGDEYEIHMEEMKQDLKEPCFFIMCLNPTTELFLGKRYFRKNQFSIQYFPKSQQNIQRECSEVAERMFWCLEYISIDGDKLQGIKMRYEVVDEILNFFVNYDGFVYKVEQEEQMGQMEQNIKVK